MDTDVTERPAAVMGCHKAGGVGLFRANPTAPGEARRWVKAYFLAHAPRLADDAELLTSELVTNALLQPALFRRDGKPAICVKIVQGEGAYRIEVYDGTPAPPPERPECVDWDSETGRGLYTVDAVAAQRGWSSHVDQNTGITGKCVWFTLLRNA